MKLPYTFQEIFIGLIVSFICARACAHFAIKRNRNPQRWFALGFFFTIFALGILLLLPPPEALQPVELQEGANSAVNTPIAPVNPLETTLSTRSWYYLDKNQSQIGPIGLEDLKEAKENGLLLPSSYLWSEGMQDWMPLKKLSYLLIELE